jgi:arylsulfatase A-like enzyme
VKLGRLLSVVTIVATMALTGALELSEAQTAEPSVGGPNVLLIVTDDQRLKAAYSYMPNWTKYIRDRGTEYSGAIATTPNCCPSRATIFTGLYTHNHQVWNNQFPLNFPHERSIQHYLHERAGYRTGIFGKFLNKWPLDQAPPYFDDWSVFCCTSENPYYGKEWNDRGTVKVIDTYATTHVGDRAVRFLRETPVDQSWFMVAAGPAPHTPFDAEPKYESAKTGSWAGNAAVSEKDRTDKPPDVQAQHKDIDDGRTTRKKQIRTLMSVDDMIGRIFAEIQARGEMDRTLVVYVSDNGYMWGEHGLTAKRWPYDQSMEIPMIFAWPGHFDVARDPGLASNLDVAPTIMAAVGLTPDQPMDGLALLQWDAAKRRAERVGISQVPRNIILAEDYKGESTDDIDWSTIIADTYQYTEYYRTDGTIEFREWYDLIADPWQLENYYKDGDPDTVPPESQATYHERLMTLRGCAGQACRLEDSAYSS